MRAVGVVGLALAACGSEPADESSGDPSIETVELDVSISDSLLAVGDVLLAQGHFSAADEGDVVYASADAGESWEPVELPDAPDELDLDLPGARLVGDRAVVSGRALTESNGMEVPGGDAYLWTSADGVDWRGGRIAGGGTAFSKVSVVDVGGGRLLAGAMTGPISPVSDEPGSFTVLRSDDGGSWSPVDLPELDLEPQETVTLRDAWEVDGDRLVVNLGGRSAPVSVEVSAGSDSSQSEGSGADRAEVEDLGSGASPVDVGDEAADVDDQPERSKVDVLVSPDGGETWEPGSCEDETLHHHGVCGKVEDYGGLLVHGGEVSVDGGETWQEPVVDPEPEHSTPDLTGVVELSGGGWLAAGYNTEAGDVSFGYLLRSSDGVRWEQLVGPDHCDDVSGRPNSRVHVPTRLGDGWLVAYTCVDLNWPEFARLYLVDADGGDLREMEDGAVDELAYGQPELVGDTAVLTTRGEDRDVAVVHVNP